MPISSMATSGFSLIAFSTASRPFAASPTTLQPCREGRTAPEPRRTSPWSSAIRMRRFFTIACLQRGRYRHAHSCTLTCGINIKPAPDQLHPFLHAGDANTNFKPEFLFLARYTSRASVATVADFHCKIRVAINSYLGLETSRMSLDVGEAFLHHSKHSKLDFSCDPSEAR